MAFSLETLGRIYAAGRNYANMGLGFAAGAGVITVAQDKGAIDALDEIGKGLSLVFHGASSLYAIGVVVIGPAIGGVLSWYAQRSAKVSSQAAAVKAAVTDPNTEVAPDVKATIVSTAKAV